MKVFHIVNLVLLILLSISTGVFKVLQQEADIELFKAIGMNEVLTTALGVIQLVGGVLLIPAKTRKIGAMIMIPTFILATTAVFANEMYTFGFVSIIFIGMAYLVFHKENKKTI